MRCLLARGEVDLGDCDLGALAREQEGGGAADPGAGTGDERYLTCEPPHCGFLPVHQVKGLISTARPFATLHTPEGSPPSPNISAELQRDAARLGFLVSQIREIE